MIHSNFAKCDAGQQAGIEGTNGIRMQNTQDFRWAETKSAKEHA